MKREIILILAIIAMIPVAHSLQLLGDQQINVDLDIGQQKQVEVMLYNDQNETYSSNITLSGNITNIVVSYDNQITIQPFGVESFYITLKTNSEGTWAGNILLDGMTIPITATSSMFHKTSWYKEGQILTIEPAGYTVEINSVSDNGATITTRMNTTLVDSKFYRIGEGLQLSDFGFKVLDIVQNVVKLEIYAKDRNTQISVSQSQTISSGSFTFYTTQYANTFESGSKIREVFTLRNGLNTPVTLKTVEYTGTVVTQYGRQPINAVQYQLGIMQPGEETNFVIEIDTRGLSPGVWTPTFTVKGLTQDGRIVQASISFMITITQATTPPNPQNITIECPDEVEKDKPFDVVIKGLMSGMTVDMEANQYLQGLNVSLEDGTWKWTGKLTTDKPQKVHFYIKLLGGVFKTFECDLKPPIPPKDMTLSITPSTPYVGEQFTIMALDQGTPINATIYFDNRQYTSPATITALLPGNYTIRVEAEGYNPIETKIEVLTPPEIIVSGNEAGKPIHITVSRTGSYYIKLNGTTIHSFSGNTTFTPSNPGTYEIYDSEDRLLQSFTVEKKGFSLDLGNFGKILKKNSNIILGVILIILVVILLKGGRKEKASHITMRSVGIKSPLKGGEV